MIQESTAVVRARTAAPKTPLFERLATAPWFSYLSILLLQLKVIWGMWNFKDLTSGDTAHYFAAAFDWYRNYKTLFTWSPLYTAFYGSFLHFSPDAYVATVAHRVLIVLALSILVLALMRQHLSPGVAWLMAAWWALLPVNFDSKYEVHLFSVIPLLAVLLLAGMRSDWARPASLAALLATTLLMRNEYLVATALYGGFLVWREWKELARAGKFQRRRVVARYGVLLALVAITAGVFLVRSSEPDLTVAANDKHTLNTCQVYAFGYQQRHNDFPGSPWFDCQTLMKRQFGAAQPGLLEATLRNPAAMIEHFWWNARLIPNGLALLLFNRSIGSATPDYIDVASAPGIMIPALAIVLALAALGLSQARRLILMPRLWALFGTFTVVALIIMITQRPRPSYLFNFGILIRLFAGFELMDLVRRWNPGRATAAAWTAAAAALILFWPAYYHADPAGRPLLNAYRRLIPFEPQIEQPGTHLAAQLWSKDLCNYIGKGTDICTPVRFPALKAEAKMGGSLPDVLQRNAVSLLYADEDIIGDPMVRGLLASRRTTGWTRVGAGQQLQREWVLLSHPITRGGALSDIVQPGSGLALGSNWYDFEKFEGAWFRWVNNDAEIRLDFAAVLALDLEPGPGTGGSANLVIQDGIGQALTKVTVAKRQTITVPLNAPPAGGLLRLHCENPGAPTGNDPRVLNFRVFRLGTEDAADASVSNLPASPASEVAPATSTGSAPAAPTMDIASPAEGIHLGGNWYPFEQYSGQRFRWVNNDAEFSVESAGSTVKLEMDVQPGAGAAGRPLTMKILDSGNAAVWTSQVAKLETLHFELKPGRYRIHVDGGGTAIPTDPRILNFRVFRIRRTG